MSSSSKSGSGDSRSDKGSVNLKYYLVLGVPATASIQEVKKAFREAANMHHPDKGGTTAEFLDLYRAYKVLSDPVERYKYDHPTTESLCLNSAGVSASVVPVVPECVPPEHVPPPETDIPPDYVFKPKEQTLIEYLKLRMNNQSLPDHVLIFDADIRSYPPEVLLLKMYAYCSNGRDTWYFICRRYRKFPNRPRNDTIDRQVTDEGSWCQVTNSTRAVFSSDGIIIGDRTEFKYYPKKKNSGPGLLPRWRMLEYTVRTNPPVIQYMSICKINILPVASPATSTACVPATSTACVPAAPAPTSA